MSSWFQDGIGGSLLVHPHRADKIPSVSERQYRLVAFDVDGTLVSHDRRKVVWELFNEHFCPELKINGSRLRAYMQRQITYSEWVGLDVADWMLAGARREQMVELVRQHLHPTPGARQTIWRLHERGYHLAVISGTIDLTLDLLYPEHPFAEVYTNRLLFDGDGRIQSWVATPYDMDGKAKALASIAARLGIPLSETVFVGDNVNDVGAMGVAGLSIAYEPKHTAVSQAAHAEVRGDMTGVLRLLGVD